MRECMGWGADWSHWSTDSLTDNDTNDIYETPDGAQYLWCRGWREGDVTMFAYIYISGDHLLTGGGGYVYVGVLRAREG